MKIAIAKILSLFTVVLLGTNIVLTSVPNVSNNPQKLFQPGSKSGLSIDGTNDPGSSFIGFNFENDPFEDIELIADLPESELNVFLTLRQGNDSVTSFIDNPVSFGTKVPRWLWVRHILI